ncbi:hypothetical protein J3R83DRAFT_7959 [Lanmaoa asiatica]|nr:hypothetical protein J3R83DRAFT_7959 [Lanmaoa asiatica]
MAATVPDCQILGPHHAALCVVGFKNEPADISTIPYVEVISYSAHSIRLSTEYSDDERSLTSRLDYTRIEFKIFETFPSRGADQHLYIAETIDGKKILVKFTRRYSFELHTLCANRGCAPVLLGYERLPGGFRGIAMEFAESAFAISGSPYVEKKHKEWVERLQNLVDSFHAQDLVHGDLRSPNIICDENNVIVIDLD